jgi:hypothetical protein
MRTHPYEELQPGYDAAFDAAFDALVDLGATPSTTRYFDGELRILPGIHLPLRSMLIDAPETRILISPVGTADERNAIIADGIDAIVAPSLLHHLHIREVLERVHPAGVWGPPGFAAKHRDFGAVHELGRDPWPFGDVLDFELIEGAPKRNEVVFFHRASRTIYTADLVFNLGKPRGLLAPLAYKMMGVYQQLAMMKPWRGWIKDDAAFHRSIDRILAWDFDRIAMAHGSMVEIDGKQRFTEALRERGVL